MAQEDKGLVIRGLILLALIGGLVTFVLALLFWRPQEPPATRELPAVTYIPSVALPMTIAGFPAAFSWPALSKFGDTLPSAPGFEIRYNAAISLARLGSARVPWPLIREMLNEHLQMCNQRVLQPDGSTVADEATAREFVLIALRAVSTWHEKQKEKSPPATPEMLAVYSAVDNLAQSPVEELRNQAEKARATFRR